jgi:hypothetical protein
MKLLPTLLFIALGNVWDLHLKCRGKCTLFWRSNRIEDLEQFAFCTTVTAVSGLCFWLVDLFCSLFLLLLPFPPVLFACFFTHRRNQICWKLYTCTGLCSQAFLCSGSWLSTKLISPLQHKPSLQRRRTKKEVKWWCKMLALKPRRQQFGR